MKIPLNPLRHKLGVIFLLACALPALACNFPGLVERPTGLTDKELKSTLLAQQAQTPGAATAQASASGLQTAIPPTPYGQPSPPEAVVTAPAPTPSGSLGNLASANYFAQSGDTLQAIALRFGVEMSQISSPDPLPANGFLVPGQALAIPVDPALTADMRILLPDSEVINSPSAVGFDVEEFVQSAGGFLGSYEELVDGRMLSGAEIIEQIADESSVNPRFLLAFLEHRTGWVFGTLTDREKLDYPLGFYVPDRGGLYQELVIAATHLNIGYYGWRSGKMNQIKYANGSTTGINPWLNPASVGVQNLFAKLYYPKTWDEKLYGAQNFTAEYVQKFGDPWKRAAQVEPLFSPGLAQPALELPFAPGERWSLTGGPHYSWNTGSPRGALDFAPVTGEPACTVSDAWVTASAPGVITRAGNNVIALDLDGDGSEQTGWVIIYLHLAEGGLLPTGQQVLTDDRLGHPSCERGHSTGTHVHITRKYNGEWLEADGATPFILSSWQVKTGEKNYQGALVKGDQIVEAHSGGPRTSIIIR